MAQPDFCSTGKTGATLSVDAARLRTIAAVAPVREVEELPLDLAFGRVLAEPPAAQVNLPPFDNAAMDGYAVSTGDLAGHGPWRLPVSGRIAAGDTRSISLRPGTAARIFTGAPIPEGTDAVIMQERVRREGDTLIVSEAPRISLNIRRRGEDCRAGEPPLPSGHLLTAPRLALLAGTGIPEVPIFRRLRVGLFSTGSELQEPGSPLRHGQIYNSNRVMLRALLTQPWIDLTDYGILCDDPGAIRATIRRAGEENDVVISSGGVSAGEEDHILDALRREDATLDVLKVAIRPGKPLTVGRVANALYVGLPGNPYAAAVTFSQIARPALRKAAGMTVVPDNWIPAVAGFDYDRTAGRREYVPVTWDQRDAMGRPILRRLGRGASASLSPIAMARGIAAIDPDMPRVSAGQPLQVEPLLE
ncbi:molybdopterin molybdotransferase MoeA [Thalassovita aquimarina]|uniref:molybdopterin molybdotransferase MoeA n=1 Tax=Thalassovita aquimarina TaxID=2785917 RepID=UPI003564621E